MLVGNSHPLKSGCGRLPSVPVVAAMLTLLVAVSSPPSPLAAGETIEEAAVPQTEDQDVALPPRAIRELGERRLRQRSSVSAIAFSPDGRWLASCASNPDPGIRLWDVATGTLVRTFHAPDGKWYNANTVAFTPDGTRVIAGHMDGKLSVWDSQTGQRLGLVSRHDRQVTAVAISSDEKTLYTGGTDGQVICSLLTDPGSVLWRQRVGEGLRDVIPEDGHGGALVHAEEHEEEDDGGLYQVQAGQGHVEVALGKEKVYAAGEGNDEEQEGEAGQQQLDHARSPWSSECEPGCGSRLRL
jgi:hypothetical protein